MDESSSEKTRLKNRNVFLHAGPFQDRQKISVGFSFFYEYNLEYRTEDFQPLRQYLSKEIEKSNYTPQENQQLQLLRNQPRLTKSEAKTLLAIWNTLVNFDGKGLSGDQRQPGERIRIYKEGDDLRLNNPVRIGDFNQKGIMECAEIATVTHDLFSHLPDYDSFFIKGVTSSGAVKPEPHAFVIIKDKKNPLRYILVDNSFHVKQELPNGEYFRMPFCSVLRPEQKTLLEDGKNITVNMYGESHQYRIGTAHTPEGTYKSKF